MLETKKIETIIINTRNSILLTLGFVNIKHVNKITKKISKILMDEMIS
jgi:hypothetical protein